MIVIEVRITNKQLEYLKKKAGKRSVPNELTDMVMNMLSEMMWNEEREVSNGKIDVN